MNTNIVTTFNDVGNGGIEFTVNYQYPTRVTASTFLANTAFVDPKLTQYFSNTVSNAFKSTSHTWSANNFFTYALSTLDNTTLGATCSYVTENFNQTKYYLGAIIFGSQPVVKQTTYPANVGEIGYTRTFAGSKTLTTGFNTLLDFGLLEKGNYIFSVKETITLSTNTDGLNFLNFFWGPTTATAEQNFLQFTGSGAWIVTPNILNYALRLNAGVTTFHRTFIVPFVNASTLVHSVRATGILTGISVRSNVSFTKIA